MYKLKDLEKPQLIMVGAIVAVLMVPFAVSLWRAHGVGWVPSGDDALIGLRSLDVFSSHRPLIGQPSTSHLYSQDIGTHHPGPIEFYWLAIPVRALGPSVGMLWGIAALNLCAVLVALWVVFRRGGPAVAAWASVLMLGVLWAQGTAILSDPISSSAGGISLLALGALCWAIADGDVRLLPLGSFFTAWVLQQHLAIVVPAAALVVFAVGGCCLRGYQRWKTKDEDEDSWWPWIGAGVGTSFVLWSPVLVQQVTGDPGNITAIVQYARTSDSPSLGWGKGIRQAIRSLGLPPMFLRDDLRGDEIYNGPIAWYEMVVSAASYGVLAATAVVARNRRRALSTLSALVIAVAVSGVYNGSSVPDSIEAFRANFYRWTYLVSWLGLIALGWVTALALRRYVETAPMVRLAPVAMAIGLLVPTVAVVSTSGYDDNRRDQDGFGAMAEVSDAAIARARELDAKRVTLVPRGVSAVLASTSALAMALESAGFEVVVPPELEARFWGEQRMLYTGADPGELILQLVTSAGPTPSAPGEVLARVEMNARAREILDPLVEATKGVQVEVSSSGEKLLEERFEDEAARNFVRDAMAGIAAKPQDVLSSPQALELIVAGYYEQPSFDLGQIKALQALVPLTKVNDDDVFELREIDAETLGELVPSWIEH